MSTFFTLSASAALKRAPANITTAEAMDSVFILPSPKHDLFLCALSGKLSPAARQGKRQSAATGSRNDRVQVSRPAISYPGKRGNRERGFRSQIAWISSAENPAARTVPIGSRSAGGNE